MDDWVKKLEIGLKSKNTVVLGSDCEITYHGRAEAHLPRGDRLIIIKPDSTLLIHQPTGSAPVNYMKSDAVHSVVREDGAVYLRSEHPKHKEYLDVRIHSLHFMNLANLVDNAKINLVGNERDMSDFIYQNPDIIEPGFKPLSREEHTKHGFIDVFGYDLNNVLVVVECKRYNADLSAVTQLRRYVERIKAAKGISSCRGIIAAPKISENARKMLLDWGFQFKEIHPSKRMKRTRDQKKLGEY